MTAASTAARTEIRPRRTGFVHDTVSIARRAIRQLPRDIAFIGPTLFIPLFFLVINVASLSEAAAFVDLGSLDGWLCSGARSGFRYRT